MRRPLAESSTGVDTHSTWVGYGPLQITHEKDSLEDESLEVELVLVEDIKTRIPA